MPWDNILKSVNDSIPNYGGWKEKLSDKEPPDDRIEPSWDPMDIIPTDAAGMAATKAALLGKAALAGKGLAFPAVMGALKSGGWHALEEGAAKVGLDSASTAAARAGADDAARAALAGMADMPSVQMAQQKLSRAVSRDPRFADQLKAAKAAAIEKFRNR